MSKLDKLKKWLTLDEAVSRISKKIDGPVNRADLYQCAINGDLKLSVYFANNVSGVIGKWLKTDGIADRGKSDSIKSMYHPSKAPKSNEMFVSDDDWIAWEDSVETIFGIWDLTMRGDEPLDVKAHYEYMASGPSVKGNPINGHGILLQQDDVVCQLYKPFQIIKSGGSSRLVYEKPKKSNDYCKHMLQYSRASHIDDLEELEFFHSLSFNKVRKNILGGYFTPSIHLVEHEFSFVIGTGEITRFIASLSGTPQKIKLSRSNERNSLLVLIAALCKHINVDWKQRGIAISLVAMTELIGAALTDETIRTILKQIETALLSINNPQETKILRSNERNSLLVLIAALCKQADVDTKQKGIAASLVAMTKLIGTPLTDDTISKVLSQIENAICSRSR